MHAILRLLTALACAPLAVPASAQEPAPVPAQPTPAEPSPAAAAQEPAPSPDRAANFVQLRYPRDKEYAVAFVDGLPIWLEELVQHITERHYGRFRGLMAGPDGEGTREGTRILESDLLAPWVRQLADIRAFEAEAKTLPDFDQAKVDTACAEALKTAFEAYLAQYVEGLHNAGRPTELSQKRVSSLLDEFQMRQGLSCELQGWIDYMAPVRDWTNQQLNDFFQDHPRYFGGSVTVQHILVQNRDAGTGLLLTQEGRIRAASRLDEVLRQVRSDGSNFEDLARRYSDDTRTGKEGGLLADIERFDHHLPAVLCRTAWKLEDGEISDVVESQYGYHIIRRLQHVQRKFLIFSEQTLPMVREVIRREEQENVLFRVRTNHRIELKI